MTNNTEKRFITIKDASIMLSISVAKINVLIRNGLIPSYKVGGNRLFDKDELIKWVESQRDERYKGIKRKRRHKK